MTESSTPWRGVIEGFYGTFYTFPERDDLIAFLAQHGFNFYAYGPKNDRQHRSRWWTPYPDFIMDKFEHTIGTAQEHGVAFCYNISFGSPPDYSSDEVLRIVMSKLQRFFERGCRHFGLLLDDAPTGYTQAENRRAYSSAAEAHADFSSRLYERLNALGAGCSLMLCPTDYHAAPPFTDYLCELGRRLPHEIDLCYTGTEIVSPTVTVADLQAYVEAIGRKPILWDNYPVNDLHMKSHLHVGPLRGREPGIVDLLKGYMANPMNQAEASKIPLATTADFLRDPRGYDPAESWERALHEIAREDAIDEFRTFAENSLGSDLFIDQAPELNRLAAAALESVEAGEKVSESEAITQLSAYIDRLDEATYFLRNRMENLALRQNVAPWIDALDERFWAGRRAIQVLQALEARQDPSSALIWLRETLDDVARNPKSIGGTILVDFAEHVHTFAMERQRHRFPRITHTTASSDPVPSEAKP